MRISEREQNDILKSFPNVELSYETNVHKKVYNSDFVSLIPQGQKCFAWFTTFKTQNVCFLLEISENKKIHKINIATTCFHHELSYGTIFYGTLFKCKSVKYFSCEDIFYYKGANVSRKNFLDKLNLFQTIFSLELKQLSYFENNILFGLPIISNSCEGIKSIIDLLPYKIRYLQFRNVHGSKILNLLSSKLDNQIDNQIDNQLDNQVENINDIQNESLLKKQVEIQTESQPSKLPYKPREMVLKKNTYKNEYRRELVFKVKPDIQNDIYHLHYCDKFSDNSENSENTDNMFDVAYIPDYKTSVMMNQLFRNIKENANLDALEESDDEEEFEDERPDKFVYLDKSYNMVCTWNAKFKKWTPIRVAKNEDKIVTKKELSYYEHK
jgi:hypothetical protein